jgi:hypothetical protein
MAETSRREMALIVASPLDDPPAGSAPGVCMRCEQRVALGPEALKRIREQPRVLHLTVCQPCLVELTREAVDSDLLDGLWASRAGDAS